MSVAGVRVWAFVLVIVGIQTQLRSNLGVIKSRVSEMVIGGRYSTSRYLVGGGGGGQNLVPRAFR